MGAPAAKSGSVSFISYLGALYNFPPFTSRFTLACCGNNDVSDLANDGLMRHSVQCGGEEKEKYKLTKYFLYLSLSNLLRH